MWHRAFALAGVCVLALAFTLPALAFDCSVANKPATAGAAYLVDITDPNDSGTPLKPNPGTDTVHGGFIALTDGEATVSTFAHAPQGVLPPVREGGPQDNCDGKGLDALDVCFGEG